MANAQSTLQGDYFINGALRATTLTPSDGSVSNAKVAADAAIAATKLDHQYMPTYSQNANSASAADRRIVHVANGAGTIVSIDAGSRTLCTSNAAITVDVLKNGTTVLASSIVLDSGNTAYILEHGSISVADYVADDVLEVNVTVAAGMGVLGSGAFANLVLREAA